MKVICPSGLTGEVRKLKGKEANTLADRKLARSGDTYDQILRGCWVSTDDPGPYESQGVKAGSTSIPWGNILVCDRFYILASIRVYTYGSDYFFKVRCGETGAGCGEKFEWEIDLTKDLDVYDLPEESRTKIANDDNRFILQFGEYTIIHKLMTGNDERKATKMLRKNRGALVTTSLAQRILGFGKTNDSSDLKTRPNDILSFLEEMDMNEQLELMSEFESVDGGIETEFEVECPNCENEFGAPVPFEGEEFWIPRTRMKQKLKRSKRQARTMIQDS